MKIVFISNFFNHHQYPLSKAFDSYSEIEYSFIATMNVPEQRKQLGYSDEIPPYVCKAYLNDQEMKRAEVLLAEADVIIAGSAPEWMVQKCIRGGKLVFRYAERPLKHGLQPIKYLGRLVRWHKRNPKNNPIYMLCASAFTAGDYAKFGLFKNKTYRWGYFPEVKNYDIDAIVQKKSRTTLLWCGRFMAWKRPGDAIELATRLKMDSYDYELQFIGMGDLEEELKAMVAERELQDHVHFLGAMKPEQVRKYMENAGIYLFTSGQQEGWGAVLNESMNSGCAVVASHAVGAVPFLMKDGENGLIYESGNVEMLYEKVKYLLDNPDEQLRMGKNAYHTITDEWNAGEVAKRFVNLVKHILAGEHEPDIYENGPCSRAQILEENWFDLCNHR